MAKLKKTSVDIDSLIERAKIALEGHSSILFAYLFGSRAREVPTYSSDIDIAVYLRGGSDWTSEKLDILGSLMAGLETDEIDLVILNVAPLTLNIRVIRNKKILLDREPYLRHSFESLTMREYFDFSRFEEGILWRRFSLG